MRGKSESASAAQPKELGVVWTNLSSAVRDGIENSFSGEVFFLRGFLRGKSIFWRDIAPNNPLGAGGFFAIAPGVVLRCQTKSARGVGYSYWHLISC
ncbi:MAG: hypothetical protein RL077_3886 [Verrucomicrobiota bacterium]